MRVGSVFLEDLRVQTPLSKDRYGSVHKVYIVCKQDRTLPEEFQRWMVSNNPVDEVKEIDGADHMAMLSAPDDVVQCIVGIAEQCSWSIGLGSLHSTLYPILLDEYALFLYK